MMRIALTLIAALFGATLAGCAATASPRWDSTFGDRVRMLNAQQLIDPEAVARNGQTTPNADGRTAREASERHVQSYRAPPPSNVITLGTVGAR